MRRWRLRHNFRIKKSVYFQSVHKSARLLHPKRRLDANSQRETRDFTNIEAKCAYRLYYEHPLQSPIRPQTNNAAIPKSS